MDYNANPSQPQQPAPSAPQQPPYGQPQPPYVQKPKRHTALIFVSVIVALIFMLIVTCPGTNAHKDAVKNAMTEAVESQFDESDNSFGKAFGSFVSQLMVNFSLDNVLTVDNYFVCSVGRIHLAGFDRTVSFGILGHVYTVNMDMAEEALKKSSKGKGKADESFFSDSSDDSDYDAAADDEAADRLLDQVSSLADSSTSKTIDDARKAGAEVNKAVQHAASTVDRASSVLDKAASALDKFLDDAEEGQ